MLLWRLLVDFGEPRLGASVIPATIQLKRARSFLWGNLSTLLNKDGAKT